MKNETKDLTLEKVGAAEGVAEALAEAPVEKPYEKKLKSIEVAPMQFSKEHMERQANKIRQRVCANGEVNLISAGKAVNPNSVNTEKVEYFAIEVDKKRCQNARRHGSKFCQVCSDAHKEVSNPEVTTE